MHLEMVGKVGLTGYIFTDLAVNRLKQLTSYDQEFQVPPLRSQEFYLLQFVKKTYTVDNF